MDDLYRFQKSILGVCQVDSVQDIDRRLVKKLVIEYLSSGKKNQEVGYLSTVDTSGDIVC